MFISFSFIGLASHGGAPAPRRAAARTTYIGLASHGGAPAPRRAAARTTYIGLASHGGAPAPRRAAARTTYGPLASLREPYYRLWTSSTFRPDRSAWAGPTVTRASVRRTSCGSTPS